MIRAVLAVLCLALLAAAPLPEAAPPPQIPLTSAAIGKFVESYGPVKALCESYDKRWDGQDFGDPQADGLTRLRQTLEAHGARDAFDRLVGRYGFGGLEDWWKTGYSTMIAYAFSAAGRDPAEVAAKIERRLQELGRDPKLAPDEKARYAAALRQSLARYVAMTPPPGNIEAVAPYRAALKALLGEKDAE